MYKSEDPLSKYIYIYKLSLTIFIQYIHKTVLEKRNANPNVSSCHRDYLAFLITK